MSIPASAPSTSVRSCPCRQPRVVGAFPVNPGDQLVLVTDAGKLIRCPVHDIRIAGRSTRGVRLFDVAEDERVVSVARLADDGETNGNGETNEAGEADGAGEANGDGDNPVTED